MTIPMSDREALTWLETATTYVLRYGGMCRQCADEDGICPNTGLPCETGDKAVQHVLKAIRYGISHGFLAPDPALAAKADQWLASGGGDTTLPRSEKDETWPAVPYPRLDEEVQIVLRGKVSKTFAGDGFNIVDLFGHNISFTKTDLRNAILTSPTGTAPLPSPAPSGGGGA